MYDFDCDWFDKDDDALMKDLQKTLKANQEEQMEEHIDGPTNTFDDNNEELPSHSAKDPKKKKKKKNKKQKFKKTIAADSGEILLISPLDINGPPNILDDNNKELSSHSSKDPRIKKNKKQKTKKKKKQKTKTTIASDRSKILSKSGLDVNGQANILEDNNVELPSYNVKDTRYKKKNKNKKQGTKKTIFADLRKILAKPPFDIKGPVNTLDVNHAELPSHSCKDTRNKKKKENKKLRKLWLDRNEPVINSKYTRNRKKKKNKKQESKKTIVADLRKILGKCLLDMNGPVNSSKDSKSKKNREHETKKTIAADLSAILSKSLDANGPANTLDDHNEEYIIFADDNNEDSPSHSTKDKRNKKIKKKTKQETITADLSKTLSISPLGYYNKYLKSHSIENTSGDKKKKKLKKRKILAMSHLDINGPEKTLHDNNEELQSHSSKVTRNKKEETKKTIIADFRNLLMMSPLNSIRPVNTLDDNNEVLPSHSRNDARNKKKMKNKKKKKNTTSSPRDINRPPNTSDDTTEELPSHSSKDTRKKKNEKQETKRTTTAELKTILMMYPLDLFLHVQTLDYNFYILDQIKPNDSQERVTLYINILAVVCRLKLPGFKKDLLEMLRKNLALQEHIRLLIEKLFCKRFKDIWKTQYKMEQFLASMQVLLMQSIAHDNINEHAIAFVKAILKIIDRGDNDLAICKKFSQQLKESLQETVNRQQVTENVNLEIFPSLEDISTKATKDISSSLHVSDGVRLTVSEYINNHMRILKQDFTLPLRDCVDKIKNNKSDNLNVFDNVVIILNEQFLDAYRHELIFVDVLGSSRKIDEKKPPKFPTHMRRKFASIKTGALLCFTTSKDFDNLILATVNNTNPEWLKKGFIGIEIVRQHNIGNIYNRPLIMFESPVFFEPYHNVFNYLKNCSATDFPMKKYIINGDVKAETPAYLKKDTFYECYSMKCQPLKNLPPNANLNLDPSQLQAFVEALKRKFCLIQGPPGTGKTLISVQIIKTLIENADTPVILITKTSETLDRLLVMLSSFTENIIRFGGWTRDSHITKYNMKDVAEHSLPNPKLKRLYYLTSLKFKDFFQKLQNKRREFDGTDESYENILKAQSQLAEVTEKLKSLKAMFQYYAAREKSVIAITTTWATRTNLLFHLLKSKIVIFEEAAEIPESYVVSCLTPHTQHLIMIGDHQQLQANTSNHQLQLNSDMNISLFERLFNKQTNPIVLKTQYRMHPKIADLLCNTIYKNLDSDASVSQYPGIRQMSTNLYFMNHQNLKTKVTNNGVPYNTYEVTQVTQLYMHLVQNALYDVQDIQILSSSSRQIDLIRRELKHRPAFGSLKASTLNSFKGLESNIVILSLVCSNNSNQNGFLKQSQNISLALSRAKHGMFIIGNLQMLSQSSDIWKQIEQKLLRDNAVGEKFPIEYNK